MTPFLTLYTPTFRRPLQLAACLESVRVQTIAAEIEQIVIPDHIGRGVGGMFAKVQHYVDAVHGRYVHMLCDDDTLTDPGVVERVKACAEANGNPPVIIVSARKGASIWPAGNPWPPVMGHIDLGCLIVRSDVWKQHAKDYLPVYEGDYWFAKAVSDAGHPAFWAGEVLFVQGAVSHGAAEAA